MVTVTMCVYWWAVVTCTMSDLCKYAITAYFRIFLPHIWHLCGPHIFLMCTTTDMPDRCNTIVILLRRSPLYLYFTATIKLTNFHKNWYAQSVSQKAPVNQFWVLISAGDTPGQTMRSEKMQMNKTEHTYQREWNQIRNSW